mmetsp:Transcript_26734/g.60889  ORF Transcript_26734/g.60889 Transcript_26734/m.60889 type:complete len:268 (-) Transcript_26734:745-1548(-)
MLPRNAGPVVAPLSEKEQKGLQEEVEEETTPDTTADGADGAADQNQPRHLPGEVHRNESIECHKVGRIVALEQADSRPIHRVVKRKVQVVHVDARAGGLVFGNRVDQWIARLGVFHEEASDAGREGSKVPSRIQQDNHAAECDQEEHHHLCSEYGEIKRHHLLLPALSVTVGEHLVAQEDQQRTHLLKRPERLPADHRDLHRSGGANDEEEAVRLVDTRVEAAESHQHGRVHPNHVDHEDVASPSSDHVDVRDPRKHAKWPRLGGPH